MCINYSKNFYMYSEIQSQLSYSKSNNVINHEELISQVDIKVRKASFSNWKSITLGNRITLTYNISKKLLKRHFRKPLELFVFSFCHIRNSYTSVGYLNKDKIFLLYS